MAIWGILKEKGFHKSLKIKCLRNPFGDPLGTRTQDPNIKSVVLYQLS